MKLKDHKIAALKHARKLISNEQAEYVCIALTNYAVIKENAVASEAVEYLHHYIGKQLNGEGALDYWLFSNKTLDTIEDVQSCWFHGKGSKKIRQTRLNWIDWMLECYEGKK